MSGDERALRRDPFVVEVFEAQGHLAPPTLMAVCQHLWPNFGTGEVDTSRWTKLAVLAATLKIGAGGGLGGTGASRSIWAV